MGVGGGDGSWSCRRCEGDERVNERKLVGVTVLGSIVRRYPVATKELLPIDNTFKRSCTFNDLSCPA